VNVPFSALQGKTLTAVKVSRGTGGADEIVFACDDGTTFRMHHYQDCCESVDIEDICGDLDSLIGEPILLAEEAENSADPPANASDESHTWTFYKLANVHGYATIRWYGSSNGYYSESVSFEAVG